MALQFTITDPKKNATYSNAYGRIDGISIGPTVTVVTVDLNWFTDATTAANGSYEPVREDHGLSLPGTALNNPNPAFVTALLAAINANTISAPIDALKTALYILLAQQPAYSGATQV